MLGRMAGGVDGADLDQADVEDVAVGEQPDVGAIGSGQRVLPVVAARARQPGGQAACGQLAHARQKIGVDVRLRGGREAQAFGRGRVDIAVDVALGIDDERLAGALAANQVGVLGEGGVFNLTKQHAARQVYRVAQPRARTSVHPSQTRPTPSVTWPPALSAASAPCPSRRSRKVS